MRSTLIKALRREPVDNIPVDFVLCDSQIQYFKEKEGHDDYESYFRMFHRPLEIEVQRNYDDGPQLFPRETLPQEIDFDEYGIGHSKGSEYAFHMTRMHHPLKGADLDEIKNYPYPSVNEEGFKKLKNAVHELHEKDLAAFGFMQMTVWEASWYLRSMEELMIDMMMEDEKARLLFDKITEFACAKAGYYAKAGTDIISLGDDIGTQQSIMMDKALWHHWLQPRLRKVIETAKSIKPDIIIFYHSCGYITPFIDDLIETGVEVLNPVQPECMDFNEIYDMYGDRLSFWGTLGTQELIPYGTAKEVYNTTIGRLEKCQGTGIVIGPTHIVEPEVPWENLEAIREAVDDYETSMINQVKHTRK